MRDAASYSQRFSLPVGRSVAFELFADPRYLDLLTPSWFRLQPLSDFPRHLGRGVEISYRLRWRPFFFSWTSLITDWQPPEYFAYEQKAGPYRFFRHEHLFRRISGGTEICDRVLFSAPGGRLVDRWIVRPDLRRIFDLRECRALALLRDIQAEGAAERGASRMPWTSASSSAIERPK